MCHLVTLANYLIVVTPLNRILKLPNRDDGGGGALHLGACAMHLGACAMHLGALPMAQTIPDVQVVERPKASGTSKNNDCGD